VGPVVLAVLVAHHSPVLILCNGILWINVGFFFKPVLDLSRLYLSSAMKCSIISKQNECVVCSPVIHPIQVLVQKMQCLFHGNTCYWSNVWATFCVVH
jgi:hypothetical protein